jgi:hypothetical protein
MKALRTQAILLAAFSIGSIPASPQSSGGSQQTSPPKESQQKQKAAKKKKKSKAKAKDSGQSDRPMNEKPPVPLQPNGTRPVPPTLPPHTPGEQPAPQSADPTRPTTTRPK